MWVMIRASLFWMLSGNGYTLTIHNIRLYREKQENQFPKYPLSKFHDGDEVLVRNHIRDEWDPKYDIAYGV